MAFQTNAFQNDAFQIDARYTGAEQGGYKRVWLPEKPEEEVKKAREFLKEIEEKVEGFKDVEGYKKKLAGAVAQLKKASITGEQSAIYERNAELRLQQVLMSIKAFEEDMMEILALLLLLEEA